MAGGKDSEQPQAVDPAIEEQWRLSRREDLADAFGIVLTVPWHGQDEQGTWRYGLRPQFGWSSPEVEAEFQSEMRALITDSAAELVSQRLMAPEQVNAIDSHPYSVGPAAQEWPKVFFDLYQDARPFLSDGASILGWGYFFRDFFKGLWSWAANKQRAQSDNPEAENITYLGHGLVPSITLTRPVVIALCYTDLVDRHGVQEDIMVDTHPRSFTDYATPDHPGGQETYLVRAQAGGRTFFYHVSGAGEVSEHYMVVGSALTSLPLPNFVGEDVGSSMREPLPSQRLEIKG